MDSANVKDGMFRFSGNLKDPEQVLLQLKRLGQAENPRKPDLLNFFLENSKVNIVADDSIKHSKISGSVSEREKEELEAAEKPFLLKEVYINKRFGNHNPDAAKETPEAKKMASDSMRFYITSVNAIQQKFVENHFNSFMGLYAFKHYIMAYRFDPTVIEPMFHKFSPALQSSDLGKSIVESIVVEKRSQAGAKVTDFTQPDANGKPFTLSSLRGKYVFVDFWASWCVPCRAEIPDVRKAYTALKNKNLEVVGISLDTYKAAWLNAIKADKTTWIQVSDLKGFKSETAKLYGISAIPQNFLVDPNGKIIAKDIHGSDLTEKLSALIQ